MACLCAWPALACCPVACASAFCQGLANRYDVVSAEPLSACLSTGFCSLFVTAIGYAVYHSISTYYLLDDIVNDWEFSQCKVLTSSFKSYYQREGNGKTETTKYHLTEKIIFDTSCSSCCGGFGNATRPGGTTHKTQIFSISEDPESVSKRSVGECYECKFNPSDPEQATFFNDEEAQQSRAGSVFLFVFLSITFVPIAVIMFLGWWIRCGYAAGFCCYAAGLDCYPEACLSLLTGCLAGCCKQRERSERSERVLDQNSRYPSGQRAGELTRREQASDSGIGSRNMSFIRVDDSTPGHHAGRTAASSSGSLSQRPRSEASSSSWVVMKDHLSGKAYYYNRSTNVTSWTAPAGVLYQVQVPAGLRPGDTFHASLGGKVERVSVPQGAAGGSTIQVTSSPLAAELPVNRDEESGASDSLIAGLLAPGARSAQGAPSPSGGPLRRQRSRLNQHHRTADVEPPSGWAAGAGTRIRLARTNTIRAVGLHSEIDSEIELDLQRVRTAGDVEELRASLTSLTERVNAVQGARAFEAITSASRPPKVNLTYEHLEKMMYQKLQQLRIILLGSESHSWPEIHHTWQSIPGGEIVPFAFDDLLVALEMPESCDSRDMWGDAHVQVVDAVVNALKPALDILKSRSSLPTLSSTSFFGTIEKNGVTLPAVFDFKEMNGTLQEKLTELCDLMEMMCSQEDVADMARSLESTQVYLQGLKDRRFVVPPMRVRVKASAGGKMRKVDFPDGCSTAAACDIVASVFSIPSGSVQLSLNNSDVIPAGGLICSTVRRGDLLYVMQGSELALTKSDQIANMRDVLYMHTLITLLVSRWHEFKPPSCKPPTFDLPSYEEATAFAI